MVNSAALALFAGLVAVAQAYTVADTTVNPSGNPIYTPETGSSVEAGKAFDITWNATSAGTVTIYLCKGPSTNCVNGATPLADKVANTGSFSWAVSTSLEASTVAGQGYGIQLISDQDNKIYQWSGQFGIVNKSPTSSSASASSSAASSIASASASSSAGDYGHSASSSAVPTSVNSTAASSTSSAVVGTVTGGATGGANSTTLQPTKPMTIPSSLKTTATGAQATGTQTTSTTPLSTGAAAAVKVGAGALVGGLFAALAL